MRDIFESGPESAFPSTFKSLDPEAHQVHRWGMTLRDYFAAKAMQGLVVDGVGSLMDEELADWAYRLADAMLKLREA